MKEISNNSLPKEIRLDPRFYLMYDEITDGHIKLYHKLLIEEERRTLGGNKGIHITDDWDSIRS